MTEVLFYHMTQSKLEQTLPGLLERSLERGWRVIVQTATAESCLALDDLLWTWQPESFLPHGAEGENKKAADHPIWITTSNENENAAQIRFLVNGTHHDDLASYERAIYMFDGHDMEAVATARERWKAEKAHGHDITYWQQDDEGRWSKKA